MNTIYHYAPILSSSSVSQRDKADFVNYALAWHEFLHGHHEGEEKHYFPAMESQAGAPGFMDSNVAQHEAFQPGLAEFHDYLTSTSAPTRTGERLREIIDGFAPDLVLHLHDEIPTILALGRAHPNVDIAAIDEVHAKHMLDTVDKFRFIPFMVSNLDHGFEDGKWKHWPPKPPVVVGWLVKWVFPLVYRGAWRFSSCEELKLRDEPCV